MDAINRCLKTLELLDVIRANRYRDLLIMQILIERVKAKMKAAK